MSKVKIKVGFAAGPGNDSVIKQSINQKFSDTIIEYPSVPGIGEWINLLEISKEYHLSEDELKWLAVKEHKYQIENVNKCDGYIEVELDIDKVWPAEA